MLSYNTINKLALFFHTILYLKPIQIIARIWFKYYHPVINHNLPLAKRQNNDQWKPPCSYAITQHKLFSFTFLNETHTIESETDWNHSNWQKLWLYNLHYFADLNAIDASARFHWHQQMIERWIADNPPATGNGWESYPLSLRIVNWVKWSLQGNELPQAWKDSLALQARYLYQRIEWHLLGNHLLANAKALIFAGCYFSGEEAERWLTKGYSILNKQLPEQILADGGHFERSPMYHSLILEDLLDLLNLSRTYPDCRQTQQNIINYQNIIQRMRYWLQAMIHTDERIAFFNDAAFAIACEPSELEQYAGRLGIPAIDSLKTALITLPDSGYLRLQLGPALALLDVAPIGPDYLPGHAHADTLSFELSLFGQRVLVNSGTSCYGISQERQYQRSTSAHNTIVIDNADSSEVWGGFRVARRARPIGLTYIETDDELSVYCGHDGYRRLPGRPTHWRRWHLREDSLIITDSVTGQFRRATAYFYFHPQVKITLENQGSGGIAQLNNRPIMRWHIQNGKGRIDSSYYHPEFGLNHDNQCLQIEFSSTELITSFTWQ